MSEPQDAMGRRAFLGAAAAGAAGVATGAEPGPSRVRGAESARPDFILDSHIHCGGDEARVEEMWGLTTAGVLGIDPEDRHP